MVYRRHICWAFRLFDESFMCFAIVHMVLTHINAAPPSLTIPVKARILCISLNFIDDDSDLECILIIRPDTHT